MKNALLEVIIQKVIEEIKSNNFNSIKKQVRIGVSARHIHISKEHLDILFGEGYELTIRKMLMGEQFAAEETVTILGSKMKAIEKVRILGPLRKATQVEISVTDSVFLGINAPIRLSGDIKNSAPVTIIGPKGAIRIEEGCIIAKRHIHMHPTDSKKFGIDEGIVSVRVNGDRAGILENVDVRVRDDFNFEMHIDIDEANALGIKNGQMVEILGD